MIAFGWPSRVWEPTGGEEVNLWSSHAPTKEDLERRREYEAAYNERNETK